MKTPEFWRVDVHTFEKILNSYNLLIWKVFDHTHSQSLYLAGRLMDFAGNIYGFFFFVNANDFSLLYELYWECNSKHFYTPVSVCIFAVVFLYISKGADKENFHFSSFLWPSCVIGRWFFKEKYDASHSWESWKFIIQLLWNIIDG